MPLFYSQVMLMPMSAHIFSIFSSDLHPFENLPLSVPYKHLLVYSSILFCKAFVILCFTNIDLKNRTSHYPASAVYLLHYFNCFRSELPSLSSFLNGYRHSYSHTNHRVVACADKSHHFHMSWNRGGAGKLRVRVHTS